MIKAPSPDNDTPRRFPRTLQEAFPSAPEWQDKPLLADRVLMYTCAFAAGFLLALLTMGW